MKVKRLISMLLVTVIAMSFSFVAYADGTISTLAELQAAFAGSGTYTVENDLDVTMSGITGNVTIDGKGHTLNSKQTNNDSTIAQNANVNSTLKNLTINGSAKTDVGMWVGVGSLTITDSTIQNYSISSGRYAAICAGSPGSGNQGTLILNNVEFKNNSTYDITVADAATVTINEGTTLSKLRLQSNTCKLNIGANWKGSFEITMDSPANVEIGTVGAGADISGITVSNSGYYVENNNGKLVIANDNGAEIHFDMNQRSLLYKGSTGFLYGVAEPNVPTIDLLQGLQPAIMVQKALGGLQHPTGDATRVRSSVGAAGAKSIQVYFQDIYLEWPYDAPIKNNSIDIDGYTRTCEEILYGMICDKANEGDAGAFLGSDGNYYVLNKDEAAKYSYVLLNEPDTIWFGNSGAKLTALEAAWKQVYEAVHKIDPNAKCAGPNFANYNRSAYDNFLSYCETNNCLPELISWHELGDASMTKFFSNYDEIQSMVNKYYTNGKKPELLVNEYARHRDIGTSGGLVKWLAMFEDKDMDGCLAYWGMANSLNEVAADQNSPSSTWWVYHWYAQMTGEQCALSSPSFANTRFYGLTSYDEEINTAYVLFGGSEDKHGKETVYLDNMNSTGNLVNANNMVHVKVYGVGFSGQHGANYKPEVVFDGVVSLTGNTLKIQVTDTDEMNAYFAIITPAPIPAEVSEMKNVKLSTLSYEAEDAKLMGGAKVYTQTKEYEWASSGRSDVGSINNNGDGVKFTVNVPEDGYYNAALFYSLQAPSVNPMTLEPDANGQNRGIGLVLPYSMQVDNETAKTIYLDSTISWSYRNHHDESVYLKAGEHTITYTHMNGNEGGKAADAQFVAKIDKLDLDLIDADTQNDFEIDLTEMKSFKTGDNSYEITAVAPKAGYYKVTGGDFTLTRQSVDYAADAKSYSLVSTYDVPVENTVYLSQGANTIGVTGSAGWLKFTYDDEKTKTASTTIKAADIAIHGTNAYYKDSKYASGGTVITELGVGQNADENDKGEDNYIELNVKVEDEGVYNIAISYSNDEPAPVMLKSNGGTYIHPYNIDLVERYAQIKVNDNEPETVYFRNTMSWDTFKTVDMQARLNAGNNTIKIYNDNSYQFSSLVNSTAPEIDCITVSKLSYDGKAITITSNSGDIDTSKLDEAIAEANAILKDQDSVYSKESLAALQAAVDGVSRATQEDVNKSCNAILDAIAALALAASDEPILWYDFRDGAKDVSGNGLDGTVNGAVITDGTAVFDGVDDYIKMPDGILKDASSATVAIYLKSEIEKQNQFTWCIGNTSSTGYMFLNTYNPNSKLRAAITLGTYTNESELASGDYVKANEWTSIVAVFDGANSALYRDGKRVATANISIKPSDLGATAANYIAKSVYNDPYFKGTVSDFRIYNKGLTADEVAKLTEEQKGSYAKTAPDITSVSGDGIKSYGVEIDAARKTVVIPVHVGTDMSKLSPVFECAAAANVTLKSGTYASGVITVTDAEDSSLTSDWTVTAVERGNAVLDGYYADPNIAVFDGKYYIYPTTDGGSGWDAPYFKCFSSDDLVNWVDEGVILDLKDVSWSNGKNGWAPTITEKNGKYYFYYSAAPADNGAKKLAVAVADSPTGPFEDKGIIVSGEGLSGQMIDSAVFTDDDGTSYLYWGNGSMYGAKLSDDMLSIEGEIKKFNPGNFREGSFMIKRNGVYYMMWSDDDTGNPNYNVRYGTMDSPLGTLSGNTQILHRNNAESDLIKGTGHHSVINVPGTDDWYICYHRFNTSLYGHQESQSSAAGNHREVCIDKMEFDENGKIKAVTPTLEGITTPVYADGGLVYISEAEKKDGALCWSLTARGDISDADIYTALYDTDNRLVNVTKNEMDGKFETDAQSDYYLKVFTWKKDTQEPIGKAYPTKKINGETTLRDIKALAEELAPDKEIRGNQYMPSEHNGVTIAWTTDNDALKSDGTAARGNEDTAVNIKAVYSYGGYTYEATYQSTVIAAPSGKAEEDMGAYLFVHFVGTEGGADDEQIYFSVSKDGQSWTMLNDKKPVITSVLREKGVRDPHIIRSPEGDKFFLIATDLSIYNRRGDSNRWGTCQRAGSQYIMIWESSDLVNWSEQRMAKIAVPDAGCAWAPESVYDYEKGQYMVFWASRVGSDGYGKQRVYRSYTTDFEHFTEPEVYIDTSNDSIDTTFINHDGIYYRFTKDESKKAVTMMKGETLDGEFTDVGTYTLDGKQGNTVTGYEGPTIYKINGENKWCLLLDNNGGVGYTPYVTDNIASGNFVSAPECIFETKYRHGTVIPITPDEYKALVAEYTNANISGPGKVITGSDAQYSVTVLGETANVEWSVSDGDVAAISSSGLLTAKKEGKVTVTAKLTDYGKEVSKQVTVVDEIEAIDEGLVMNITFDEEKTGTGSFEATDGGTVTEKGIVSYKAGKHGNALNLAWGTGNYLELPDGLLNGAKEAAVSFWVKQGSYTSTDSWPFMTTVAGSAVYKSEKYIGVLLSKNQNQITLERYYSNSQERPTNASASGSFGNWNYVTVNIGTNSSTIYVNGSKVAEAASTVDLSKLFTADAKSWIGHANWNAGEGFVGMIDDFRLYSRTLSEDEISKLMNA